MTKSQTLAALRNQLDSFYSLEQVIRIIEGIQEETTNKVTVTEIGAAIERLVDSLESNADYVVDYSSAEFGISCESRIELEYIRVNSEYLREALENTFIDFGQEV